MSRDRFAELNCEIKPLLIVLSGLSGAGKDTILDGLRKAKFPAHISVSTTTRSPRPGEKEGYDYFFTTKEKFQEMIKARQMLEWAEVYGNYYGRPLAPVKEALEKGQDVIIRIDVQGAATIKKKIPQAVLIFLTTQTREELENRLKKRRTESRDQLDIRLKTAEKELEQLDIFDYVIVNREGDATKALADVTAVINAEKCRVNKREVSL